MVGRGPRDAERRNEGGLLQDASPPVNPHYRTYTALVHWFYLIIYIRYQITA